MELSMFIADFDSPALRQKSDFSTKTGSGKRDTCSKIQKENSPRDTNQQFERSEII
jgi:hypothetical protein